MDITISYIGAFIGLVIAIIGILYNVAPVYSLLLGALIGGLLGGATLSQTVSMIMNGSSEIIPDAIRILTAGVLVGVLVKTGSTTKISMTIINFFGRNNIYGIFFALAIAGMILSAVGVFIEIAIITLAPIALAIAKDLKLSRCSILVALSGGGKSGNIISPNPNTIAGAEAFDIELLTLMFANIIPAFIALLGTVLIAYHINRKLMDKVQDTEEILNQEDLPSLGTSLIAPGIAIFLLTLDSITNIVIDPLIALPIGGVVGCIAMRKINLLHNSIQFGLQRMGHISLLLLGAGALSGIIKHSDLNEVLVTLLNNINVPTTLLAPLAGVFMGLSTASTTMGTTVASHSFSSTLLDAGIDPIAAAATLHSGATVFDHSPHGSFFHITAGSLEMDFNNRLKALPYETFIGLIITVSSWVIYFLAK